MTRFVRSVEGDFYPLDRVRYVSGDVIGGRRLCVTRDEQQFHTYDHQLTELFREFVPVEGEWELIQLYYDGEAFDIMVEPVLMWSVFADRISAVGASGWFFSIGETEDCTACGLRRATGKRIYTYNRNHENLEAWKEDVRKQHAHDVKAA